MSSLPTLGTEALALRAQASDDLEALARIVRSPSVAAWWGRADDDDALRDDLRSDGCAFTILVDGSIGGWLGVAEELTPDYHHAALDIVLATAHQDRGLGSAALRLAARWLFDARGHHRLTIDPALANARAIRAYEAVGFRPVGVMREYERDAGGRWHDNLLMDLLAEELVGR